MPEILGLTPRVFETRVVFHVSLVVQGLFLRGDQRSALGIMNARFLSLQIFVNIFLLGRNHWLPELTTRSYAVSSIRHESIFCNDLFVELVLLSFDFLS